MTAPVDGVYLAPDLDEQAQSRALLREVIVWARANGWKVSHRSSDDHNRTVTWEDAFRTVVVDADESESFRLTVYNVGHFDHDGFHKTVQGAVDVLAALAVLPAPMSSGYKAGYDDGHADGCGAVTEMSVMNMVDIELDKLEGDAVQAALADRIRHRLADGDDPYETRAATREIVESVWHVMERAS